MPNIKDIVWFKSQLGGEITTSLLDTPFTLDLVTAIACQETGYIWQVLRKKLDTIEEVLALCVGDTIDAPGRSAFPKNKAALVAKPRGDEMFAIAREALERVAEHIDGYKPSAAKSNKFMRGYGIFQYDLQFFLKDPDFFLNKEWIRFDSCLAKLLAELRSALVKVGLQNKPSLTDMELAHVAIAYNKGSFNPALGLKQGHKSDGKFYGESIFEFIALSKTAPWTGAVPADVSVERERSRPGVERHKVVARDGLRLRGGPDTAFPVLRLVPFGAIVDVLRRDSGWALIDLEGDGRADGHMHASFLERV
jgi:hypothetical protein